MPDNLTSGTLNEAGRIVRKSGNDYGINLADWVRLWPTPTANDSLGAGYQKSGQRKYMTLPGAVGGTKHLPEDLERERLRFWPTPTSISPAKNGYNEAGNSCGLVAIRKRISDEDSQATGQLSPMWVEWLMGFPLGWTDLEGSETQ
jgi:hypothetical protein